MFSSFFNEILFRPFFNTLIFFYNITGDFGVAIILLTITVRFVLYPLSGRAIKSQQELSKLQPKIQEIQKKYNKNQKEQAEELMRLYKEHGVNPFSGCLPLLIQLPVFFALFEVFRRGLDPNQLSHLYYFISAPVSISPFFFNIIDLQYRSILIAVIVGLLQLAQSFLSAPPKTQPQGVVGGDFAKKMNQQMIYMVPVILFIASLSLPAGVGLYLAASTLFGVLQQMYIMRTRNLTK